MKENKERKIIISGYGTGNNNQPSVALYSLDENTGRAEAVWGDTVVSPSYMCTYQDMCFGIREEEKNSSVLLYKREEDSFILQDRFTLYGGSLCHIVYQPKDQTLYCAFYGTGHVAAIRVENYRFSQVLSFFQINSEDEANHSRARCCTLEPVENRVLVTDIAKDRIYLYDSQEGVLTPNSECEYVQLENGIGPRHLKFHPIQNYLYLITEYSNEILTFLYQVSDRVPQLILLQRISTLPEDFNGSSAGATLEISKDGRFLYAANCGADTIAVYDIKPDGILQKIQDAPCHGNDPKHIALTKDDTGLMIANQHSNEVIILDVDENSGKLLDSCVAIPFASPSFVEEL